MVTRRKVPVFLAVAAAVVVFGGMSAFACTNLATLGTSATSGEAGTAVTVSGSSFAAAEEGAAPSPVRIHWNAVDGPVLAELAPDARGSVSGAFDVPDADPGHYVVVATQVDEEGEPQFGTPARAPFEIVGPSGESVPPPTPQVANASSDSGSDGSTVLVVALGVVAVGLFAAGFVSFLQARRRVTVPEAQPVRRS